MLKLRFLAIQSIIIINLLFIQKWGFAQMKPSELDSLENQLTQNISPQTELKIRTTLMGRYQDFNPNQSEMHAKEALTLSQKFRNHQQEALIYSHLGQLEWAKGNLNKTLTYHQLCLEIARNHDCIRAKGLAFLNLGNIYGNLKDRLVALENFHQANLIFQKIGDTKNILLTFNNIGWQHVVLENYDSAEYIFNQALPLAHRENSKILPYLYDNLGESFFMQKQYDKAIPYLQKSLYYSKEFNSKRIELVVYRVLGEILLSRNEIDSAEHLLNQSLELAIEIQAKQKIYEAYGVLHKIMKLRKQFEKAYEYQAAYVQYSDSLFTKHNRRKIEFYEYQKEKSELALLRVSHEKQTEKQNGIMLIIFVTLIMSVIIAVIINQNRNRIQYSYRKLERANYKIIQQSEAIHQKNEEISQQKEEMKQQNEHLEDTLINLQNTQSQLVQSEKMNSLGVLTASIAHEINNPINYVSGGVQSLETLHEELWEILDKYQQLENITDLKTLQDLKKELLELKEELEFNEDFKENLSYTLQDIQIGIKRVIKVVRSLQTFVRLDENEPKIINLHDNLEAILVILGNRFMGKIELKKSFFSQDLYLDGFPAKINQAFINLLFNAEEALNGRGKIELQTSENEKYAIISIKDNGCGIPSEIQEDIFKPLFSTKPQTENSGLGLTITQQIIEEHQGKLEVFSEAEKGTEVIVYLPKPIL